MRMVIITVACLFLGACMAGAESPTGDLHAAEFRLQTPGDDQLQFPPASYAVDRSIDNGQHDPSAASRPKGMWAGNASKFFQGALIGLAGHEGGHVIANFALNTDPYLKSVNYGPIPFFTIEPGRPMTNREHYITASAGFNAQHIVNEWILTKHPDLSAEDEPLLKGVASFNFWLTVGYAASAFAGTGPSERDTKGMADSLGWNERWIGAMILVPTALDTYRYKHPDARWAVTASRLSKLAIILLAFDAQD